MPFGRAAWTRRREASRDSLSLSVSVDDWKESGQQERASVIENRARVHKPNSKNSIDLAERAESHRQEPVSLNTAAPTTSYPGVGVRFYLLHTFGAQVACYSCRQLSPRGSVSAAILSCTSLIVALFRRNNGISTVQLGIGCVYVYRWQC